MLHATCAVSEALSSSEPAAQAHWRARVILHWPAVACCHLALALALALTPALALSLCWVSACPAQGIVSGVGRELSSPGARGIPIKNVIQTDAGAPHCRSCKFSPPPGPTC